VEGCEVRLGSKAPRGSMSPSANACMPMLESPVEIANGEFRPNPAKVTQRDDDDPLGGYGSALKSTSTMTAPNEAETPEFTVIELAKAKAPAPSRLAFPVKVTRPARAR
jgi:hypothetical protein